MQQNIYETIMDKYSRDLSDGRIFMYENMGLLMRKNPLLKRNYLTYTTEDILSEAFLIADEILLRKDISEEKKVSKLWYLFNRGGWFLYGKLTQYNPEIYNTDDLKEWEWVESYMDDEILDWILVSNNVITPVEEKVLSYIRQWHWKYEIARLMKTTYYNIKSIVEWLSAKIERFIKENDLNAN